MFERILLPVDGSACALRSAHAAADLARSFGSHVTILHVLVMPPVFVGAPGAPDAISNEIIVESLEKTADEIVQGAREVFDVPADRVAVKVLHGHPAEAILRCAVEERCTLIVIGCRGLSEVRAFFTGSVSDKVNHHAPCSVLMVH